MIFAHAARDAGFKRCCLRVGRYDGAERAYYFQTEAVSGRGALRGVVRQYHQRIRRQCRTMLLS